MVESVRQLMLNLSTFELIVDLTSPMIPLYNLSIQKLIGWAVYIISHPGAHIKE